MSNSNNANGQQNDSNRPATTIRYGAIKATISRNETRNGPMYSTTVTRTYKEGDDWRESRDMPVTPTLRLDTVFGRIGGDRTGVFGRVLREGFHAVFAAQVIDLAVVGRDERRAFHLVAADRAHGVVHVHA